ncbi:C-C chemokine receptor type 4 [Astyanax mexicanus]|uniref:C-C chemokine receptor type 5-like n=1 Tax=Astyanax mexicanus TaxID=7994 RepID=A0A8B9RLI6_ASTMX|nr:C-C chemokine receptor type 4 [Astyanax mexicanus]KAG9261049.1 C-C chemokine receptor type 5-like [Astyanax mexicanus]
MSRYLLSTAPSYDSIGNQSSMICNNSHVRAFSQVVLPTLYSLVCIVGILGNGLVMCVLTKYLQKSNMMDVCLFNLAVSDMLFLITLPFWAHYSAVQEWIFGDFLCRTVTALHNLGFYSSIFFMLLMTVDRYVVTVHALSSIFFKRSSCRVGAALVLLVWVLSVGASIPEIVFSEERNETTGFKCEFDSRSPVGRQWKLVGYVQLNVLGLLLPIVVMGFCYSKIIPTLVAMKSKQRFKAIKLMLVMIFIFFLCWTPYHLVAFLKFLSHLNYLNNCTWQAGLNLAMPWVETIAYSHCCLNPFIYFIMGQRFRTLIVKVLKEWFPMCFSRCNLITTQLTLKRNMRHSVIYSTTVV